MNFKKITAYSAAFAASAIVGSQAFAAGYEKSIMWGGHSGGEAGIATPWIAGSDALYFNPAGLATDKAGKSVSFNISPTRSTFSGPVDFNNDVVSSTPQTTTPLALIYSQSISDAIGLGLGVYTSGGARAMYDNVDMQSGRTANLRTNLAVNELALGGGYKLNDQWKLGASIRYIMGTADFAVITPKTSTGSVYSNTEVNGIKANAFAFKFGAQYKASEKTRYSLVYRSETNLSGDGTWGGFLQGPAPAPGYWSNTTATAHTVFPMQVVLGTEHDYEKWRALAELTWTQYSRVGEIAIDGSTSTTVAGLGSQSINGAHVGLNFRDEYGLRLAGEYIGYDWPIRFGMIYGTPVTDAAMARANLTPPGPSIALTVGTGKQIMIGDQPLNVDGALEYDTVSGSDSGGTPAGTAIDSNGGYTRAGNYSVSAYALHLGVGYNF